MESNTQDEVQKAFAPWVTWVLIALNCLVFIATPGQASTYGMIPAKYLIENGALSSTLVWNGEVWRLFTAMFLHGAFWHLLMNMWVLNAIGGTLEKLLGRTNYLLLYLISGVFGYCTSLILHPGVSVGASGAIFGVTGGLLGIAIVTRGQELSQDLFKSLFPFVAGTLAIGYLIPLVDNSAHVGGLIMGILLGYAFGVTVLKKRNNQNKLEKDILSPIKNCKSKANPMESIFSDIVLVLSLFLFAAGLFISVKPTFSPYYHVQMGYLAIQNHDIKTAETHLKEVLLLAPDDQNVALLKARLLISNNKEEQSQSILQKVLKQFDESDQMTAMYKSAFELGLSKKIPLESDLVFTQNLCHAAITNVETPGFAKQSSLSELYNNCAWFNVMKKNQLMDAIQAIVWARQAIKIRFGTVDNINYADLSGSDRQYAIMYFHTLATAHQRQGEIDQAIALIDRLESEGIKLTKQIQLDLFHWKQQKRRQR